MTTSHLTGNEIRTKFLEFFESKGHAAVASSSLVPNNDPTLMFVNSGMVQFKNVFLGLEQRDYNKATTSQRCVRAGGKHNDLENVGHTARHHTFFEMLGNFSFGDYFKEDAIKYAWEFITEVIGLPKDKLCVTIYHTDEDAYKIWRSIGVADEDIIRIDTSDNFWTMGDNGPCGPCTEIFYDHGEQYWGDRPGTAGEDGDRFIEIWNLVFMQNIMEDGKIVGDLPMQCVDTGMGLERITAVCQHVNNNYDIDMFQSIIQKAAEMANVSYAIPARSQWDEAAGKEIHYDADGNAFTEEQEETHVSLRVIGDHIRATSFLLVDGVMPSNEGRGYVLRRIMRRAMRHINMLGITEPFLCKLVSTLVSVMGDAYPELKRAQKMVTDVIELEEKRFGKTLANGLKMLEQETENMGEGDVLDGAFAFKLYDTYGFPMDLTEDAVKAKGISVNEDAFNTCMEEQRAKARAAHKGTGDAKLSDAWFDIQDRTEASEFLGYENIKAEAELQGILKDGKEVDSIKAGDKAQVVFNQTPFYGESGGQVGDTGTINFEKGQLKVTDTQKILDNHFFVHTVEVLEGTVTKGEVAELCVDEKRRNAIKANHSATHLMHEALREVLGDHVFQKGSYVDDVRLRLDFSQPQAMNIEQIQQVEDRVNEMIWANKPVTTRLMDKDDAVEAGAMALFGEKYDAEVRVLFMGDEKNMMSVELCGGTHVDQTGDIGMFKLLSDSSVAAGVRRVEATTGQNALLAFRLSETQLREASASMKTSPADLNERISALQADKKKLENDLKEAKKGGASGVSVADLVSGAEDMNGIKFVGAALDGMEPSLLREMVDDLKNRLGSGVIVLGTNNGEKSTLVAGVTKDLIGKVKASDVVNAAAATLGGKGGGRPDMAMAGGKAGDIAAAVSAAKQSLAS